MGVEFSHIAPRDNHRISSLKMIEGAVDAARTSKGGLRNATRAAVKKALPNVILREIQEYRKYGPTERGEYLKMRLSNRLGLTNPKLARISATTRSVIFVCFGNIMRSPMAEALLQRELAHFNGKFAVTSAGLNTLPGTLAHPWSVEAASELGISLEKHRSRLLTPEMVNQADVIFAMDYHNQVQLLTRWPGSRKKIFMLSAYAGRDYRPVEIADPYYQGLEGTRICYSILVNCSRNLAKELSNQNPDLATDRGSI